MMIGTLPRGSLVVRNWLLAATILYAGIAAADEAPVTPRRIHHLPPRPARVTVVEEIAPAPILLLPNCFERWPPRIMNCVPQVYAPFSQDVLIAMEAPARIRKLPYPTLFPYHYGN